MNYLLNKIATSVKLTTPQALQIVSNLTKTLDPNLTFLPNMKKKAQIKKAKQELKDYELQFKFLQALIHYTIACEERNIKNNHE